MDNIDLLLPMDTIDIGKNLTKYFGGFKSDLLFHKSALQSLVHQNIYNLLHTKQVHDMTDLKYKMLYQGSSLNLLTTSIQLPIV
jgi:hypothetical protein